MKRFSKFCFLFLLTQQVFSQQEATVSGRIVEEGTNESLPYATVMVIRSSDEGLVTGSITDESGRFSVSGIPVGDYSVKCSYIGYREIMIPLVVGGLNSFYDLGKIELEVATTNLGEVVVTENRDLVTAGLDRRRYDISANVSQSGGSVLDVMRNLPGITVDQEGKIELRGSDKVTVLIDGKQSSLTGYGNMKGLSSIPALNLETIEIINNPSARYDASGMAGIINIIYKKEERSGLNGDAGLSFGLGALSRRKGDLPTDLGSFNYNHKIIPGLNLNYRSGRLNFFFQGEILNQRRLPNNEFTTRTYNNGDVTASQVPENRKQTQYIIKGGVDLNINERNILTFSMIYDYESHHDSAQVPYIDLLSSSRYRYWTWLEYEITGFMNYSLDYKHMFAEPGHELDASIQYIRGWEDEAYHLNDSSEIRISNDYTHILAIEKTFNLNSDYVKPLRNGRFEAGIKLQARRIPVTYDVIKGVQSIIYPGLGDKSDWGEDIFAGYLNWVMEARRIEIEAGLRAEQAVVFYELSPNDYYPGNDSYSYFNIYPNLRLTYKINQNNSLSAFFNKRIDRPGEPELRVFPKYDDPELLKVGNPYLRPQYTTTGELAYKLRWGEGSLSLAGYHRAIKDPFTRIYSIDSTNTTYDIVNKIYSNVGSSVNTGMEIILNQDLTKFWKFTCSVNWYSNIIHSFSGTLLFPYPRSFSISRTTNNSADIKINNQFSFWNETQLQLTALYYTPRNIPQGRQLARSSVDVGIKKPIIGGKGELTFSFNDIFNDFGIKQKLEGEGFTAVYENYYETQIMILGFKYKF